MICHDYGDRAEMRPADQRLVAKVGRRGWAVLGIPEDDGAGSWAFTVGLWHSYRVPEVALFGLPTQECVTLLELVGDQVAAGARLEPGQLLADVLAGDYRVTLRPIAPSWHRTFFGAALRFYRDTPDWSILHCVWPDRSHLFPGDPDFDPSLSGRQPQLLTPPEEHPKGVWADYHAEWVEWSREND